MFDSPRAVDLLSMVENLLRDTVLEKLDSATAYQVRVACTVLAIARREIGQGVKSEADEVERLRVLLGCSEQSIRELNRGLADRLRTGQLSLDNPDVLHHLWQTTFAKLAVDQPSYPRYEQLHGKEPSTG